MIIDFEGEPAIALSERRLKRSPLRDVAGMIRSFDYAAWEALRKQMEHGPVQPAQVKTLERWARFWSEWVSAVYYNAYRQSAGHAAFLPPNEAGAQILMDAFLLRKAVYELGYELTTRPDWVEIPLRAIIELMNQNRSA